MEREYQSVMKRRRKKIVAVDSLCLTYFADLSHRRKLSLRFQPRFDRCSPLPLTDHEKTMMMSMMVGYDGFRRHWWWFRWHYCRFCSWRWGHFQSSRRRGFQECNRHRREQQRDLTQKRRTPSMPMMMTMTTMAAMPVMTAHRVQAWAVFPLSCKSSENHWRVHRDEEMTFATRLCQTHQTSAEARPSDEAKSIQTAETTDYRVFYRCQRLVDARETQPCDRSRS